MKGYAKIHRGFTIEQVEPGKWHIRNCPTRAPGFEVRDGPYGTFGIASHVIDNVLDSYEKQEKR